MKRIQDYDYGTWQYKAPFGRKIKDRTREIYKSWKKAFSSFSRNLLTSTDI